MCRTIVTTCSRAIETDVNIPAQPPPHDMPDAEEHPVSCPQWEHCGTPSVYPKNGPGSDHDQAAIISKFSNDNDTQMCDRRTCECQEDVQKIMKIPHNSQYVAGAVFGTLFRKTHLNLQGGKKNTSTCRALLFRVCKRGSKVQGPRSHGASNGAVQGQLLKRKLPKRL